MTCCRRVDHRRYRSTRDVVDPSTEQGKSDRVELRHRRRQIDLAVEPRLHVVLFRRGDIEEMTGHQRSNVTGDHVGCRGPLGAWTRHRFERERAARCRDRHAGRGEANPFGRLGHRSVERVRLSERAANSGFENVGSAMAHEAFLRVYETSPKEFHALADTRTQDSRCARTSLRSLAISSSST